MVARPENCRSLLRKRQGEAGANEYLGRRGILWERLLENTEGKKKRRRRKDRDHITAQPSLSQGDSILELEQASPWAVFLT